VSSRGRLSCQPDSLGFPSVLLALVALAMQIVVGAIVPVPAPAASLDRLVAVSICHGDAGANHGEAPSHHHSPDCAVCPLCQAIAQAGAILASPMAAFVAPALAVFRAFAQPPARAPPSVAGSATSARGPPATT